MNESDFKTIHDRFINNMKSLESFFFTVFIYLKEEEDKIVKKNTDFELKVDKLCKSFVKKIPLKKNIDIDKITEKVKRDINKATYDYFAPFRTHLLEPRQLILLFRSAIVILKSYYDSLLTDLLDHYYRIHKKSIKKEKKFTTDDLLKYDSIEDLIDDIISEKVNSMILQQIKKQLIMIKQNEDLKINLNKEEIINWDVVEELFQRRNIIVHNDGIVNKHYLNNINKNLGFLNKQELKEGCEVTIDKKYFLNVFDELILVGIIIVQKFWRKFDKNKLEDANHILLNDTFNLLIDKKWKIVERLGIFSRAINIKDKDYRLYMDFNYLQSLKWQKKEGLLNEELKKYKIDKLGPIFKLAKYVLMNDKNNFYKNIKNAIIVDKITREDFFIWPLFREFRKDKDYKEKIENLFNEVKKEKQN